MLKHFQQPKKQWSIFLEIKGIISKDGDAIKTKLDFLDKEYFEKHIKGNSCIKIENKYWVVKSGDKYIIDECDGIDILKERLEKSAITDPLTGCVNKKETEYLAEKFLKNYLRYNVPFSVFMLDIDFFKKVNDTYGHLIGDYVLKEVAHEIKNLIRESDICGRFGGEEFLILAPNTKLNGMLKLANRIKNDIENHNFEFENQKIKVTVSIGVTSSSKSDSVFSLIERADEALYDAKRNGRNRVEYR